MTIQSSTSDLVMIRTLTGQINSTQKELYAVQKKSTSEFKNEHYYDMEPTLATQSIYVEDLLHKNTMQIKNYEWSENLLYMQEASIKRFIDIIEDSKKLAVQALNNNGQILTPNIDLSSRAILSMIEDELLTEYFGMNIWNGSRTNESPFIDNDLVNGTIGANYYQGDNFNLQLYIADSSVEFGDRANLSCFSDLIKALQIMRDSQNTSDGRANIDDLKNASDLLDKAQVGILSLLQKIGSVEETIISAKNHAKDDYNNLSEMYTNSLNGMSEEDRAINLIDAAVVQRKMGYILPITMKYLRDMSIIQYL